MLYPQTRVVGNGDRSAGLFYSKMPPFQCISFVKVGPRAVVVDTPGERVSE